MAIKTTIGLNYNKEFHYYILDRDYYTERTATNLEEVLRSDNSTSIDTVVTAFLQRASTTLYDYMYSFNPRFKKYLQYEFCHEDEYVVMIRECLLDMVNYWVLNGLDPTMMNPILNTNVENNVPFLTEEQMKEASIPVSVKLKIKDEGLTIRWGNIDFDDNIFEEYAEEESNII